MKKVTIKWQRVLYKNLANEQEADFYFFTEKKVLIYLGIAYSQPIIDEINQSIRAFNYDISNLSFWLGRILKSKSSFNKISLRLVKDTECLLIFCNQPRDNDKCTKNYTGKNQNLKVICENTSYLYRINQIKNGIITTS